MILVQLMLVVGTIVFSSYGQNNQGCSVDENGGVFKTSFGTNNQAEYFNWEFTLEPRIVENTVNWPNYPWMPDGHLSSVYDSQNNVWYTFYPNHVSYRTTGSSPLPQHAEILNPSSGIMGGLLNQDAYNNGGEWLMSAQSIDDNGGMIGFLHTEDRFWTPSTGLSANNMAYKSVSLACSQDWGNTWQSQGQLLTVGEKPGSPEWSGSGDQDVVWDWQNQRWFMMTGMSGAVSYSKNASQSSWLKWNGTDFSRNSILEPMEPFKDTEGNPLPSGANPSIHWNTYLQLWVVVYHGWNGNIYITSAKTLPNFSPARVLVRHNGPDDKVWYPTLMSKKFGDRRGTRTLLLYYRLFPNGLGSASQFVFTRITLCRDAECANNNP